MTAESSPTWVQSDRQREHHRSLFGSLHEWERTSERIFDLSGKASLEGLIGVDQMGHFGPQGCDLVLDAISRTGRPGLRLCELGSGFGGALRYLAGGLAGRGLPVEWAVGIELVHEHCLSGRQIGGSIGHPHPLVCADVGMLPIRGASVDYVVATGSVPHFPDMAKVLREAVRVLRPGGRIIMTEEVSLTREADAELPLEFRLTHPSDVFFTASPAQRRSQLNDAGLVEVEEHDLLPWAGELLRARIKALDLFRGSVEGIYGATQTERIMRSLRATLMLYEDGTLLPTMFLARRGPFQDRDDSAP